MSIRQTWISDNKSPGAIATLVRQRAGVMLQAAPPPGAARTAPTPYTTHSFESESKANENERRRMHEMPHYTSTWIGCHVRRNKQRNWWGDQLLHKAKTSASLKNVICRSIYWARIMSCLISYKRSNSDRHRRLWLWKLEGLENRGQNLEGLHSSKFSSQKSGGQFHAVTTFDLQHQCVLFLYTSNGALAPLSLVLGQNDVSKCTEANAPELMHPLYKIASDSHSDCLELFILFNIIR